MTTPHRAPRLSEDVRADLLVGLVVAAALALGWFYRASLQRQTVRVTDRNSPFALEIPAYWLVREIESADTFLSVENPRADSVYKTAAVGRSFLLDPQNPAAIDTVVDRLVELHGDQLLGFHLLDIRQASVGPEGAPAPALVIEYAYVVQPIDQPFRAAVPVVVHALDYVVYTPREYWLLTFSADEQLMGKEQAAFDQILRSIAVPD